jgi:hypothetical protein
VARESSGTRGCRLLPIGVGSRVTFSLSPRTSPRAWSADGLPACRRFGREHDPLAGATAGMLAALTSRIESREFLARARRERELARRCGHPASFGFDSSSRRLRSVDFTALHGRRRHALRLRTSFAGQPSTTEAVSRTEPAALRPVHHVRPTRDLSVPD